jgi:GNAT superfamily N-acetyltransferase
MDFRPATPGDLADEFEVFDLAQRELYARRGADWTGREFSDWEPLHLHLLDHDGARSFVAQASGRVVGFTAAWVREGVWFLSALFVLPEWQGRGIGRRLLNLAWGEGYRRRITVTAALQPVSTASYARRGLIPTTPILRFEGEPLATARPHLDTASPDPDSLRLLDQAAYGFDRSVDHSLWRQTTDRATLWRLDGEAVAYSYVSATGVIGPLAGRDETSAAGALRAELARRPGRTVAVAIPGTCAQLVEVALAVGLSMQDPGLLLLSPPTDPPRSLAIRSDWLL